MPTLGSTAGIAIIFYQIYPHPIDHSHFKISDHWKRLLEWSLNLRALCLWNIPISDKDLHDIFLSNSFEYLEDLRIGASEIGFVRLTEKSCTKIFETCQRNRKIGGLCDWNFSDMCEMMKVLTMRKGWKLKLHPLIMYNAFNS